MYGCHNKPRPNAESRYLAQSGYSHAYPEGWGYHRRDPRYVEIKSAFGTTTCQYDKSSTDARCAGCNHMKGDTK